MGVPEIAWLVSSILEQLHLSLLDHHGRSVLVLVISSDTPLA